MNDIAIKNIASVIGKGSPLLVHFSTDYVFDGNKRKPYNENDEPRPINEYGKSKLNGEINIRKSNVNYFILELVGYMTTGVITFQIK